MLRIGLTGGIGSGKSTVAAMFASHGAPVIDADEVAHRVIEAAQPAYRKIVEHFGSGILDDQGNIDRKKLRVRVFSNAADRQHLEAIVHPEVRRAMEDTVAGLDAPYCILVIPLLFEASDRIAVDRILVIDAEEERQFERAMHRDGGDAAEIRRIIRSQIGRQERLARAEDVLRNNAGLPELERQVAELHRLYTRIAEENAARPGNPG